MQILDALAKYLVQLEADGRSPHTIAQYRRHVRALARWAADVGHGGDIGEIGHEDLAQFLCDPVATTRPDGGKKKATSTNALRTSLRCFFRFVHQADYASTNAARLIRRARCAPSPPRAVPQDDLDRLLAVLAEAEDPRARRDHALFLLITKTGIRVGSAVAIEVEDLDLDSGEVQIRSAKGDQPDVAFLGEEVVKVLRDFIGNRSSGPLFAANDDRRVSIRHVQRRFAQWLEKAGVKRRASVHGLRHAFAERLYDLTGDLLLVRDALGHRTVKSTEVYSRVRRSAVRAAVAG